MTSRSMRKYCGSERMAVNVVLVQKEFLIG
jgi:hypothetical protein